MNYDDNGDKFLNVSNAYKPLTPTSSYNVKRKTYKTIVFISSFLFLIFIQNILSKTYVQYCTFNVFQYFDSQVFLSNVFIFLPSAGGPVCKYIWLLVDHTHNIYLNLFLSSFISCYS